MRGRAVAAAGPMERNINGAHVARLSAARQALTKSGASPRSEGMAWCFCQEGSTLEYAVAALAAKMIVVRRLAKGMVGI